MKLLKDFLNGIGISLGCGGFLALMGVPFAAWLTHVITCFEQDRWGFLIAGAIFFPVAIVHGIYIWFHWAFP